MAQLEGMGCDMAQGYYFERPRPAGEISRLLAEETLAGFSGVAE